MKRNQHLSSKTTTVLILFCLSFLYLQQAWAGLSFKNCTNSTISLAIGFHKNGTWMASGWFIIKPGERSVLISGDLDNRYYYYYAHNAAGSIWGGETNFCVNEQYAFTEKSRDNCSGANYVYKGFYKIDTEGSLNFTVNIKPEVQIEYLGDDHFCVGDHKNTFKKFWHKQQANNWCWAACIQMILHKQGSYVIDQCKIVSVAFGQSQCPDVAADGHVISKTVNGWEVNGGKISAKLNLKPSKDDLINDLSYGYPIIVAAHSPLHLIGGSDHGYVLTSIYYRKNGEERIPYLVTLFEPSNPSPIAMSWAEFYSNLLYVIHVNFGN